MCCAEDRRRVQLRVLLPDGESPPCESLRDQLVQHLRRLPLEQQDLTRGCDVLQEPLQAETLEEALRRHLCHHTPLDRLSRSSRGPSRLMQHRDRNLPADRLHRRAEQLVRDDLDACCGGNGRELIVRISSTMLSNTRSAPRRCTNPSATPRIASPTTISASDDTTDVIKTWTIWPYTPPSSAEPVASFCRRLVLPSIGAIASRTDCFTSAGTSSPTTAATIASRAVSASAGV